MIKKTISLLTVLVLLIIIACTQTASQSQTLIVKIKVINFLPVGWGVRYQGVITEVIEGELLKKGDTILFGIIASKTYEDLYTGDIRIITFENSGKKNEQPYFPAMSGMVSKQNEIWLITKIEKPE